MASSLASTSVESMAVASLSAASSTSTSRATPQGGILEGANPSHYDSKNPVTMFIIQVCALSPVTKLILEANNRNHRLALLSSSAVYCTFLSPNSANLVLSLKLLAASCSDLRSWAVYLASQMPSSRPLPCPRLVWLRTLV